MRNFRGVDFDALAINLELAWFATQSRLTLAHAERTYKPKEPDPAWLEVARALGGQHEEIKKQALGALRDKLREAIAGADEESE